MKTNKVVIDLEEYNKLRDFKIAIEGGLSAIVDYDFEHSIYRTKYISSDKAVELIAEENNRLLNSIKKHYNEKLALQKEVESLRKNIKNGEVKLTVTSQQTMNDISKMSVWQFLKLKRSLKKQ